MTVQTENISVARKYFTLLKKTFNIEAEIRIRKNIYLKKSDVYRVQVNDHEDAVRVLQAAKFMSPSLEIAEDLVKDESFDHTKELLQESFPEGNISGGGFDQ